MESPRENCLRAFSSPDLTSPPEHHVDPHFVGLPSNVSHLLKLIHEHNEAYENADNRIRDERIAEMLVIIEDVKSKIQKSQCANKKREPKLRRCNTDLRRNHVPRDKKHHEPITDENDRLRKELNTSMAARKTLESMCSSIGKEKMIIAKELARNVQQLQGMEEHVNDLKAQNEMLMHKVQACVAEHRCKKNNNVADARGNMEALHKENRVLKEQLLKTLDAYRSLRRKVKEYQEKRNGANARMEEMGHQVRAGLYRINSFKDMINHIEDEKHIDIEQEISELEHMFKCFDFEISKKARTKKHDRVHAEKLRCPA